MAQRRSPIEAEYLIDLMAVAHLPSLLVRSINPVANREDVLLHYVRAPRMSKLKLLHGRDGLMPKEVIEQDTPKPSLRITNSIGNNLIGQDN